jgi:uncharacterized FlaG/YvyC family protein
MTEQVSARTEALEIPFPIDEIYNYSILLPKGYDVITPEASFTLEKDFGTMTVKIAEEGRTLQIIRSIHLAKQVIDIAEYADFRQMMNTWNNKKYREIIFRKGPK